MLPRFQHILVPVDFTLKNRQALDIAFDIAGQNAAKVTLLHVIEKIDHVADEEVRAFYEQLDGHAQSELESMTQRFFEAGIEVDRKIRFGKRAEEIVRDSSEREIDLIVMNSHPLDPEAPIHSMGTLSYQVSLFCRCPVLLVK